MKDKIILTAESVTEGHPDKLCDTIADSVLDACLERDPSARVACEVMATAGKIIVAGEITAAVLPDIPAIVCQTVRNAGYGSDYEVEVITHDQSRDTLALPRMSRPGCCGWAAQRCPCWTNMGIRNRMQRSSASRRGSFRLSMSLPTGAGAGSVPMQRGKNCATSMTTTRTCGIECWNFRPCPERCLRSSTARSGSPISMPASGWRMNRSNCGRMSRKERELMPI